MIIDTSSIYDARDLVICANFCVAASFFFKSETSSFYNLAAIFAAAGAFVLPLNIYLLQLSILPTSRLPFFVVIAHVDHNLPGGGQYLRT